MLFCSYPVPPTLNKIVLTYLLTYLLHAGNSLCTFNSMLRHSSVPRVCIPYIFAENIQELSLNGRTVNETVNISLTEDTEILCEAKGSIPAANIQIFLDDKNITSDFTKVGFTSNSTG